jgi:endonuclease/exonuclease/phosphatase family metal-dependent hydrolase
MRNLLAPNPRVEQGALTVATYNVHQWIGRDRRVDPRRTIRVIRELDAEVIGLQEVILGGKDLRREEIDEALVKTGTGMTVVQGRTMLHRLGEFGNVLLTAYPVIGVRKLDLSVDPFEPRGVIDADLEIHGARVRVLVTHLGLHHKERHDQVKRLLSLLPPDPDGVTILLGDVNEWRPLCPTLRLLNRWFGRPPARRTFPTCFPALPLDRIWVRPKQALKRVRVHVSRESRIASDHLPIVGIID